MDTETIYENWKTHLLTEIARIRPLASTDKPNESDFLFSIAEKEYYTFSTLKRVLEDNIHKSLVPLFSKLHDAFGLPYKDKGFRNTKTVPFIYIDEYGKQIGCFFVFSKDSWSQQNSLRKDYPHNAEKKCIELGIDRIEILWMIRDSDSKINEYVRSWEQTLETSWIRDRRICEFFEARFGIDEWNKFLEYVEDFKMRARFVLGYLTVPLPTEEELSSFRSERIDAFLQEDIPAIELALKNKGYSEDELDVLRKNFIDKRRYYTLFGTSEFAESFIASEWRFYLNGLTENTEQTGTVAGFVKFVEQMLWECLTLWSDREEEISIKEGETLPLTSTTLEKKKKDITMGTLKYFFGGTRKEPIHRNIFENSLDIQDRLFKAIGTFTDNTRNGKFHKENFHDIDSVKEIRSEALQIFYLVLGAQKLGSSQEEKLLSKVNIDNLKKAFYSRLSESVDAFLSSNNLGNYDKAMVLLHKYKDNGLWSFCINLSAKNEKVSCQSENMYFGVSATSTDEDVTNRFVAQARKYLLESKHGAALKQILYRVYVNGSERGREIEIESLF